MKITEKPNHRFLWDKNGVELVIQTNVYMIDDDHPYNPPGIGDLPGSTYPRGTPTPQGIPLKIQITGTDTPTIVIHDEILKHIPGAMEGIKVWMDKISIMQKWEEEVATYKRVVQSVVLPDVIPTWGQRRLFYALTIKMQRDQDVEELHDLPDLQVSITIDRERASFQLWVGESDDDDESNIISRGPLPLPITMESLKAKLRIPFQHYLSYL